MTRYWRRGHWVNKKSGDGCGGCLVIIGLIFLLGWLAPYVQIIQTALLIGLIIFMIVGGIYLLWKGNKSN